jgi:hypothetical protein
LKIGVITPTDQLTGTTPDDIKIVINLNENNHDDVLNARISQAEIENAILIIRNDKSSGVDNVTIIRLRKIKILSAVE